MEFTVALSDNEKSSGETAEISDEAAAGREEEAVTADDQTAEKTEPEEEAAIEPPTEESAVDKAAEKSEEDEVIETDEEPEPDVTVAEAEPVFKERDAVTETAPPPDSDSKIRILGKRRPLNHPTWTAADILMNEPAFRDAQAHALSSLNREVAGFLIGPQPEKQPDGRYLVHISDIIIAKHTKMQGASVTYTPESWRYVTDRLAEMYPDETAVIVGWYHTHPGFGIFLSGMDQFIHRNFFIQSWHVALVLDPIARRSGFFCWDRPQTKVDHYDFPWPNWAAGAW
jgi:proteasome lid subunit RPN8/RPN11